MCFWVWVSREPVIVSALLKKLLFLQQLRQESRPFSLLEISKSLSQPRSITFFFLGIFGEPNPIFWSGRSGVLIWWSTSIISTSPSCFSCRTTVSSCQTTVGWGGPSALCSGPEEVWLSGVKSSFFLFFLAFWFCHNDNIRIHPSTTSIYEDVENKQGLSFAASVSASASASGGGGASCCCCYWWPVLFILLQRTNKTTGRGGSIIFAEGPHNKFFVFPVRPTRRPPPPSIHQSKD